MAKISELDTQLTLIKTKKDFKERAEKVVEEAKKETRRDEDRNCGKVTQNKNASRQ